MRDKATEPGDIYHELTVVREVDPRRQPNGMTRRRWLCRCSCGEEKAVNQADLRSGNTKSCGCHRRRQMADVATTHGLRQRPEYSIWADMLNRCHKQGDPAFSNYGGRGIFVIERWHDFENFYADMGPRPEGMTLERRDNDGPYAPRNCVWATRRAQARNRRSNHIVDSPWGRVTVAEAAERSGLKYNTLLRRVRTWGTHDPRTFVAL